MQNLRDELKSFLIETEDAYWKNWVGLQADIDIVSLYSKYSAVFTKENVLHVMNQLQNSAEPDDRTRLQVLFGILSQGYLEFRTSRIQQEILQRETLTTVDWNGKQIPLRNFSTIIQNEPNRSIRKQMIDKKELVLHEKIIPLKKELLHQFFNYVQELGYSDYVALCEEAQNRDFSAFAGQMEGFLSESEAVYRKYLNKYLNMLTGHPLDDTSHIADLTAVFRCAVFDEFFPKSKLLPVIRATITRLGFTLDGIRLDLEERPGKKPRACVSAVNPPEDVRLTVYPLGGYDDYAGLLHELGHAIHFKHEIQDLDFEYKYWGDRGFTEGTAYLFQNITMNRTWLREMIHLQDPEAFLEFNAFLSILRLRRLIGQFLYQMKLFRAGTTDKMDKHYQEFMTRAHCVQFDTGNHLNFDWELYSAGYVRARLFEVQMRHFIQDKYGESWWKNRDAGDFLKTLYATGRKPRADKLILDMGFKGLDSGFYLREQMKFLS